MSGPDRYPTETGRTPWLDLRDSAGGAGRDAALAEYAAGLRQRFPDALAGVYAGDRAFDRFAEDDEVDGPDVVVVFDDEGWSWSERVRALGELAFDVLIDTGVLLHGHPIRAADWNAPQNGSELAEVKASARRIS